MIPIPGPLEVSLSLFGSSLSSFVRKIEEGDFDDFGETEAQNEAGVAT